MADGKTRGEFQFDDAIVVASHPRSGTHLVIDLLRRQFSCCESPPAFSPLGREPYGNLDQLVSESAATSDREIARIAKAARPLLKTHRRPDFFARCQYTAPIVPQRMEFARQVMARAPKIYVYRSVSDVMRSLFLMTYPNAEVPFGQFIREVRGPWSRVGWWAVHLVEWMRAERTHLVFYDELLREPKAVVTRLGEFIGEEPLMRSPILPQAPSSPHLERLQKLLLLRRESTALMSFGKRPAAVRTMPEDLVFMRQEATRVDPGLPGLPDGASRPA